MSFCCWVFAGLMTCGVAFANSDNVSASTNSARIANSRLPANALFENTGMFVNSASALPPDRYAPLFKKAKIKWLTLQIDNGGKPRADNVASVKEGWAKKWRDAGFVVGFWGAPRGISKHNNPEALQESTTNVQADAVLAVKLTHELSGEFYIADCEDSYQGYNPTDPAPGLNRVYVDAFEKAAAAVGFAKNAPCAFQ